MPGTGGRGIGVTASAVHGLDSRSEPSINAPLRRAEDERLSGEGGIESGIRMTVTTKHPVLSRDLSARIADLSVRSTTRCRLSCAM